MITIVNARKINCAVDARRVFFSGGLLRGIAFKPF